MAPFRIAVVISGRGSNMLALADAVTDGRIPDAEIAVVVSDHADAEGLARASARGIETLAIERKGHTREEHEREIIDALKLRNVDLICLAGYMRILSQCLIDAFRNRILNIHPSLLPSFPGLDAQRQAIEHGVKFSGCSVHFVDESLDAGPIITQAVVPVYDEDTELSLSARILETEHRIYAEAVALVLSGDFRIEGRRIVRRRT